MKRIYAESNGYNMVLFVDDENKAFVLPDDTFNDFSTLELAKAADYSNLVGCETAEECRAMTGAGDGDIIDYNEDEFENVTEF